MKTLLLCAAALILLAVAGLVYAAGERLNLAGESSAEALESTLRGHRIAHALKSLASGYELAMNEYYSTVLEFHAPEGVAMVHVRTSEVRRFLDRSLGVVPVGREHLYLDLDHDVAELLRDAC